MKSDLQRRRLRRAGRLIMLAAMTGGAASCASSGPATCLAEGNGIAAVRNHIVQEEKNGFAGSVALEQGGGRLLWASDGYDAGNTRFWLASISKSVTATAAVRLAQEGRLDLDLTVGEIFPEVSGELATRTLAQLLAMRAGLGDHYAADGITSRQEAVRRIAANGIEHEGFFYSNDSYNLAAAMMEKATGTPFEALLRQAVFQPLGMQASGVWGEEIERAQFAKLPDGDMPGIVENGRPIRNYGYFGSTGVYSTAKDMLAFLNGVQSDEFLSPEMRAKLWTPGWAPNADGSPRSGQSYGLGWGLKVEEERVTLISHGGYETHLHNGQIVIVPGRAEMAVLADKTVDGDYTWSKRILEGVRDCLGRSG